MVLPTLQEAELFDEAGYLRLYPGIREAIGKGQFPSAWAHYDRHGRAEGRRLNDLDPDFYLRTYGQIADPSGTLTLAECAAHYAAFGRGRGYRPNAGAERPPVQGGLWTDAPDALDAIEGQSETGRLTDRQAAMLRNWRAEGVLVLDRPAPRDRLEPAALDIERIFAGACPDAAFECPALAPAPRPWQPEIAPQPAAALDVHFVSSPVRKLILGDPITEFMTLLLQGRLLLAASRGFLRPPTVPPRRASALFGCSIPRRFVTVWIALEDTLELRVWKASHRLPPIPVAGRFATLTEALQRGLEAPAQALAQYDAAVETALRAGGLSASPIRLKRGEVALLHPELVHALASLPPLATARGVCAQLCPRSLLPVYAEREPTSVYGQGADRFASALYRDIEPLD